MPVIDTEVLFAMNPRDPKHGAAGALFKQGKDVKLPDTVLLEFQLVLRGRGRTAQDVADAMLSLRKVLSTHRIAEVKTIDTNLLVIQGKLEDSYGLSYFDSLIAASAIVLGEEVVTDNEAFERVPHLVRKPFTR